MNDSLTVYAHELTCDCDWCRRYSTNEDLGGLPALCDSCGATYNIARTGISDGLRTYCGLDCWLGDQR